VGRTVRDVFGLKNILTVVSSFILTYFLVIWEIDWNYFLWAQSLHPQKFFLPGIILGMVIPLFLPFALFLYGKVLRKHMIVVWAGLIGQSAFLGWFFSSTIKAFTGRIPPNLHNLSLDISHNFYFGVLNKGIFWGFPSSHTTVAFSVSVAVCIFLEKIKLKKKTRRLFQILLILYALYIAISISLSIHWLTDMIVGILLGTIIGKAVGKNYSKII
jgi:membrane-associated phospholipid phosphatase